MQRIFLNFQHNYRDNFKQISRRQSTKLLVPTTKLKSIHKVYDHPI